jgi:hypothetical protein
MPPKALMSQYRVGRQSRCPTIHIVTPQEPSGLWPAGLPFSGIIDVADAVAMPTARGVSVSRRTGRRRDADGAGPARGKLGLGSSGGERPGLQILPSNRLGTSAKTGKARQGRRPQRPAVVRCRPAATMALSRSAGVARRAHRWTVGLKAGVAGIAEVAVSSSSSPFPGIVSPAEALGRFQGDRRRGRQDDRRGAQSTCVSTDRSQPDDVSGRHESALAAARSDESGCEPCPVGPQMSTCRPSKGLDEVAKLLDERDGWGSVSLCPSADCGRQLECDADGTIDDRRLVGLAAAFRAIDRPSRRRFCCWQTSRAVCPSIALASEGREEPDRDAVARHGLRKRQIEHAVVDPAQAIRGGVARRIALVPDPFPRRLARFSQDHGRGRRAATAGAIERRLAIGPSGDDQATPAPNRHAVETELRRELATGSRRPGEHVRRNGAQLVERMDSGEHRAGGRGEAAPARTAAPALQRTTAFPPSAEIRAAATGAAGDLVRQHLDGAQRAAQQQLGTDTRPAPRQRSRGRIGACCRFSHVTSLVGDGCLGPWQQNLNEGLPHERAAPRSARANAFSRHGSVAADPRPGQGGLP